MYLSKKVRVISFVCSEFWNLSDDMVFFVLHFLYDNYYVSIVLVIAQTIIYKILRKKQKIGQQVPHLKTGVNSGAQFQSGFRSSYSTDTCLIHLFDHIKSQTAKGLYTGMIMLDLQKAFDTVDHEIFVIN